MTSRPSSAASSSPPRAADLADLLGVHVATIRQDAGLPDVQARARAAALVSFGAALIAAARSYALCVAARAAVGDDKAGAALLGWLDVLGLEVAAGGTQGVPAPCVDAVTVASADLFATDDAVEALAALLDARDA